MCLLSKYNVKFSKAKIAAKFISISKSNNYTFTSFHFPFEENNYSCYR